MANDYLRYKYYLITRIPANYLFTAVKRIIASGKINMEGTIREAVNSEVLLELANELKIAPNVMEAILTAIVSKNESQFGTYITVVEPIKTGSNIKVDNIVISVPKKDISVKTSYEGKYYCKMFTSPIVIPRTFYGGLLSPLTLKFTTKSKVNSAIKKAIKAIMLQNIFADTNIATTMHSNIESNNECTIETLLQAIGSMHITVQSNSQVIVVPSTKKDTAINVQHKQNNISQLRTTIIVLKRARLVDYALYTLQQLNPKTLQEMKYKGE